MIAGLGTWLSQRIARRRVEQSAPQALADAAETIASSARSLVADQAAAIGANHRRIGLLEADLNGVKTELLAERKRCEGIERELRALRGRIERDD